MNCPALGRNPYPALTLSSEQQRQQTQDTLVAWLQETAEHRPVLVVWDDLHWADPSTLETLALLVEQAPTVAMLHLLTFRPEFEPPWPNRSHMTPMALNRLERPQVEVLMTRMAEDKVLPVEVVEHIVSKTDGVPLYVEEMTKAILEAGVLQATNGQYELSGPFTSLAIPGTLQDALMARLDRLDTAKGIAQLGATIGRQFDYALLHAVLAMDEETLQRELRRLVEAELVHQRGVIPQATYTFKHALIQDTAYASLLRSRRQEIHQRIVEALEEQFVEVVEAQPELVAHHYTEAGNFEKAVGYWRQAGQRALERSANTEAIAHLQKGIELLRQLADTPECLQRELALQMALGPAVMATKGYGAPEVEQTYLRAEHLCEELGETSQLCTVRQGLWNLYYARGELRTAHDLGEQSLTVAHQQHDSALLLGAHRALGTTLFFQGEFVQSQEHLAQGIALYDPHQHRSLAFLYGHDLSMVCFSYAGLGLSIRGYAEQALARMHESSTLAQELSHPHSLAFSIAMETVLYQHRREVQAVQDQIEALIELSNAYSFPYRLAHGHILDGWTLAKRGQAEEGIAEIRHGIAAYQATGAEVVTPWYLSLLAEAYENAGQIDEGLRTLAEALTRVDHTGECWCEAELYRQKGELLLADAEENSSEAEACFHKAIEIARYQQAKLWELRTTTSLARLWQSQGKCQQAYDLLAPVYEWFTEGFDTADLIDAKALLGELVEVAS